MLAPSFSSHHYSWYLHPTHKIFPAELPTLTFAWHPNIQMIIVIRTESVFNYQHSPIGKNDFGVKWSKNTIDVINRTSTIMWVFTICHWILVQTVCRSIKCHPHRHKQVNRFNHLHNTTNIQNLTCDFLLRHDLLRVFHLLFLQ